MYVTLIRLLEQAADIVITLNVPTIPESPGTRNEAMMREMVSKLGASFEIKDWNLFNGK